MIYLSFQTRRTLNFLLTVASVVSYGFFLLAVTYDFFRPTRGLTAAAFLVGFLGIGLRILGHLMIRDLAPTPWLPPMPPALLEPLLRISTSLVRRRIDPADVAEAVRYLAGVPSERLPQWEHQIAYAAGLDRWSTGVREVRAGPGAKDIFEVAPEIAWLYLFHRNGHLREAALTKITSPPTGAFLFSALVTRMNDWVPQVRQAASDCAERIFPETAPEVIAQAAFYLLPQSLLWGRWTSERLTLDRVFARPDVIQEIAATLSRSRTGPTTVVLEQALRHEGFDASLADLSRHAVQPALRALALRVLLKGAAVWREYGFEKDWTDKSMGRWRTVPKQGTRPVHSDLPKSQLIQRGLSDRSVRVRRVAVDAIDPVRDRVMLESWLPTIEADHSSGMQFRAAFLRRRLRELNSS